MDCSPSGSSVHGVLQARILEWVAISFSSAVLASAPGSLGFFRDSCTGVSAQVRLHQVSPAVAEQGWDQSRGFGWFHSLSQDLSACYSMHR